MSNYAFRFCIHIYSLVHVLRQPDIRDASGILAEQMNMGIQDRRIDRFTVFPQNCLRY